MTRAELISSLYAHFEKMHSMWSNFSRTKGVGAFMFFPEDYEQASDFSEVQWEFWDRERLLKYILDGAAAETRLRPDQEEFLSRVNTNEFLSVVVRNGASDDIFQVEIHRIDRAILN